MTDEVSSTTGELRFSNEINLEDSEMLTGTEELEDLQSGHLSLKEDGFDPINEHIIMHDLYQPFELEDGRLSCKICLKSEQDAPIFATRNQFHGHRYRHHGITVGMNLLQCPDTECDQQFSSIIALKKHLQTERDLPIEYHYKHFANVEEFEIWRSTVEQITGSRFVLHNRQIQSKRNVMHCFRSEHKVAAFSKNVSRDGRMRKHGSVCPAHITFIENHTGSVDAVYQLFHFGHDLEGIQHLKRLSREDSLDQHEETLSINTIFPVSNRLPKSAAMQYIQLCLVDMPDAVYLSARYSQLLVVLDVQSYFIFAKPIPNPRCVSEHVHKSHIIRQLVDIFTQFGCPVGFSVCGSSGVLFDSVESIEDVFNVNMTHVGNVTRDLSFLKKSVLDRTIEEFGEDDRWPEVVPFVVYALNSEGGGEAYLSPFEMMFGRRPPHSQDPHELVEEANDSREEANVDGLRFEEGDSVLVRYFDADLIPEGATRNASQPQPSTEYLNGLVGGVDWYGSPFYPYKVYICRSTEEPNTDCPSIWASPFDVAPTLESIRKSRNERRRGLAASIHCVCTDEWAGEKCKLPRSHLCTHKMSRVCCEKMEGGCEYHDEYNNGGGDGYKRVEGLARRFLSRDKYEKEESRREELEKLKKEESRLIEIESDNDEGRSGLMDEGVRRGLTISSLPSLPSITPQKITLHSRTTTEQGRRRMDEEDQSPSTSQVKTFQRVVIAEKKPFVLGMKRRSEWRKDDGEADEKSPLPKKGESSSPVLYPATDRNESAEESNISRRKSGRATKPNTLYKSFAHH
ncbi:hypothetical protein PMAYCL1PPCAC_24042 [Pristionchus mayeri]|uniref:C2H2-type domain-containing protein n=1 Tax=Pristionchus mayeri TaxID=1317129 RepID=A0AAN5I655_9BILA|nr:hypothetical protein PMAYCL1PPCAC_24042 [Pristionchus mayeri]